MSTSRTLILAATILAVASAAAQTSAAKDEPTPGMEPVQPVMDRPILAHVIFSQLEGRWNGTNSEFRWEGQGWVGTDYDKLWNKSEGTLQGNGTLDDGQHQFLYDRAITTYFDLQGGLRSDIDSRPTRNWAAFGIQGLAPYFFDLELTGYASNQGHLAAKLEASYDLLIAQRLILQPQIELNLYSKADPVRLVRRRVLRHRYRASVALRVQPEFRPLSRRGLRGQVWPVRQLRAAVRREHRRLPLRFRRPGLVLRTASMRCFLVSLAVAIVLVVIGGLALIYSGLFDIAASDPDWPVMRWVLQTTRTRSIQFHAAGIPVPPGLDDPTKLPVGTEHFAAHCAVCHGAPGVPKGAIAEGLNPQPPDLAIAPSVYTSPELFWILKHGIKMTGMPSWSDHSDDELWATVSFLEKLPNMNEQDYAKLVIASTAHGGHHGGDQDRIKDDDHSHH